MNKIQLAAAFVLLAPAAVCAASFEGRVNLRMIQPGAPPQELSYQIKGDKIRVEFPGQNAMGGMLMDTAKRETTFIMDEQKMYLTMALPEVSAKFSGKTADVALEKTGEKRTILGHTAEKYLVTQDNVTTEMWLAEGLGTFMMAGKGNPMGGRRGASQPTEAWERALAGKELFPLLAIGRDKGGKETFRMEVTAIEKQDLPDSLFTPPAGYQKLDMGGMMKGMLPGMRPGRP